jgi:hypothetical protein
MDVSRMEFEQILWHVHGLLENVHQPNYALSIYVYIPMIQIWIIK